jgi:F-type H+-transporting ATPase subunit delta
MIGTRAALRYAKAAIQKSIEDGTVDALAKDMKVVYDTVQNNRDLEGVLQSPVISSDLKHNALQAIFAQCSPAGKSLLRLVAENNRTHHLDGIAFKVIELYQQHLGLVEAIATTAVPITPELEKEILTKVARLTDKKVTLVNKVDPAIVGGFVLRLGDVELNASVAHQLNSLKQTLRSNAISWQK